MGIKNWTVTAESTKSAASREIYFHNMKDKNHKNTERYLDVFGGPGTTANIIRNAEERRLKTALQGKGGRPPTEAMEFVLTLPKGIRPDLKQWQDMTRKVLVDVAKRMEIEPKELSGIVRAVAHQQRQDGNPNKGSGDHVHLMVGKFTNEGKYLPKLQQKGVLNAIKLSFNAAVRDVMGIDHKTYEAKKTYEGLAKKKAPQWQVYAARAREELNTQALDLEYKSMQLGFEAEQVEVDKAQNAMSEAQADLATKMAKLSAYLQKLDDALVEGNHRQLKRQTNRTNKGVMELAAEAQAQEEAMMSSPELQHAMNQLNNSINKLNSEANTELPNIEWRPPKI